MHPLKFTFIPLIWLLALSASAETSVTAIFNPPRIALGDKAQYIVEIKETSNSRKPNVERITSLPIPQSGGLKLSNGRTSSSAQTRITNGVAEYSATQQLIIDAKPPRVATFTIPTYVFQYKGETLRAPAATLEVVERASDAGPTTDELIFLKTDTPSQLYVGQTTPIQLKLYISENVRLTGLNNFDRSADGFTISELPESQENGETYNGRRYRVLTWPLTITPIQTGEQDLNFQFTVSAQVPEQNNTRRDPFGGRGFGSSIFDDFFGRSERFTVYNEPTTVDVRPLPQADQPASFTGAIGDFSMEVYTDRESTQAGEPIMLSIEISGKGNFDRINGPTIPKADDWRSYDPESKFQPRSANNVLHGTKRFDYVMIPNKAGKLQIPEVEFAYFDPKAKHYITLSSPRIPIEVSPSATPQAAPMPTQPSPTLHSAPIPLQQKMSTEEALLTLDYRTKASKRLGNHALHDPRFWLINIAIALALIGTGIRLHRRRRLKEDPTYAAQRAAKAKLHSETLAAKKAQTAEAFYAHAQNAIRFAVSCRSRQNLHTANINELTDAMHGAGITNTTIQQTRTLFQTADALRFAGITQSADLPTLKQELERILKAI